MNTSSKVVLITGCSTGIGWDLAEHLSHAGHRVVATARKADALRDISAALKLSLDVTQPDSVRQAVMCTLQEFGQIDVLVNNAGYALRGAVEEVPVEKVQQMFDVNVFGVLRMVQAVAPHMRERRAGRIINISSLVGKLFMPVNGTYTSTKFALEALSDTMRLELAPFGVQVILVEPGAIKTNFADTAQMHAQAIIANPASPYRSLYRRSDEFSASMRQQETGPEIVSQVIQQAIESSKPKVRYHANIPFSAALLMMHLGDPLWNLVLKHLFKTEPPSMN